MFGTPTYQAVIFLVAVLSLIFIFLLGYTFWTRTKKKYWDRYGRKFRDMFAPLIFDFVDSARKRSDADPVVRKVTRRREDIELFIDLVDDMAEILSGDDSHKLGWLIKNPLFDTYYRKKLTSTRRSDQLLACVYYTKSGDVKLDVAVQLFDLCSSNDIKIAFGAAKALQSSTNHEMRFYALKDFFVRTDATELMIGELLHLFHHNLKNNSQPPKDSLKQLLLDKDILKERKDVVIEYITHHNLYEYSTFLHQYLQRILYRPDNKSLIKNLITAIGVLRVEEAAHLVRSYAAYPDPDLRVCCVEALNQLGGEENLLFITNMLLDIEFDVRKRIIQTLVQDSDNGHLLLDKFMLTYLRFLSKVWSTDLPAQEMFEIVNKLQSITQGIRIASANKKQHLQTARL